MELMSTSPPCYNRNWKRHHQLIDDIVRSRLNSAHMTTTTFNPDQICKQYEQRYPRLLARIEDARLVALAKGVTWPTWCYVPIGGVQAVLQSAYGVTSPGDLAVEAAIVTALASWRMGGKNVLVFDEDVLAEIWNMPLEGDIPTDVLLRLPFWCAYVPTPPAITNSEDTRGVFMHLEHDVHTKRPELRFVSHFANIDGTADLYPIPFDIDAKLPLDQVVNRTLGLNKYDSMSSVSGLTDDERDALRAHVSGIDVILRSLVAVALYLAADNAEVRDPVTAEPAAFDRPSGRKKIFAPSQPTTWNLAWRIGAAIRRASQAVSAAAASTDSTRNGHSVRPHMRRAHWHSYRTGKRAEAATWKYIVRWLPPIPVNMPDDVDASAWAELMPTVERRVE